MKKYFIITVDTEPDGQWDINAPETMENAKYIKRFQILCDQYNFKPVYLTDYVMLKDSYFTGMMNEYDQADKCEIGMHLHAWDTPPFSDLDKIKGNRPYLIEYSEQIMEEKIKILTNELRNTFSREISTHRAGRWALDKRYIQLLDKYDILVDCSITPHIDWSSSRGRNPEFKGPNYSNCKEQPSLLENSNILEIPVTVRKVSGFDSLGCSKKKFRSLVKSLLIGNTLWYRPALFDIKQMTYLYSLTKNEQYLEMMIHSSELMPGGSPYFPNRNSIEMLYKRLTSLFELVSQDYEGITLRDYGKLLRSK